MAPGVSAALAGTAAAAVALCSRCAVQACSSCSKHGAVLWPVVSAARIQLALMWLQQVSLLPDRDSVQQQAGGPEVMP
jgi:hypothetical protein